jgi:hypothetical protein
MRFGSELACCAATDYNTWLGVDSGEASPRVEKRGFQSDVDASLTASGTEVLTCGALNAASYFVVALVDFAAEFPFNSTTTTSIA